MWLHRLGDRDAARRLLEAVVPDAVELLAEGDRVACLGMLSEVAADLGDRGRCERLLAELEPEAGLQMLLGAHLILGCASRALGMLARALGRFDEAERHFEVALAADTRMGARPWIAVTQLAYAALLLERGGSEDRRRAEALLDQACATADELGMAAVTRRAEAAPAVALFPPLPRIVKLPSSSPCGGMVRVVRSPSPPKGPPTAARRTEGGSRGLTVNQKPPGLRGGQSCFANSRSSARARRSDCF